MDDNSSARTLAALSLTLLQTIRKLPAANEPDPAVPPELLDEIEKGVRLALNHLPSPARPPAKYLRTWCEILSVLDQPDTEENRNTVRTFHKQYDGPLIYLGSGNQPRADRDELLAWWNGLGQRWREIAQRQLNKLVSVDEDHQYQHGRAGTVCPEIDGYIRFRRKNSA